MVALVCVAVAVTVAPRGASAQAATGDDAVREQARVLFEEGLAAYQGGEVSAAAGLFQQSVDLRESPTALYNLAMCRRELGENEPAIAAFRRYVEVRGADLPAEERAEIEAMVVDMGGTLEGIEGLGPHPGGEPQHPEGGTPESTTTTTTTTTTEDGGVDQLWFWITAGGAVALGITAGVTGYLAYDTQADFASGGHQDLTLRDRGQALQLSTNILAGLAGAAGVAALVLAFFTGFGEEAPEEDGGADVALVWPGGLVVTW
jgi:tetratricopeptide (TPR) repeat protein